MKVGILEFRYGNNKRFKKSLEKNGHYSINLGDWVQTMAIEQLVQRASSEPADLVRVDRDTLPTYQGPPIRLVMNACFLEHSFPISDKITPIFIGFQTSSLALIESHRSFFEQYAPIGCRDHDTLNLFQKAGIDAYITGCLTLTFPRRNAEPENGTVFFAGGEGAGILPRGAQKHCPKELKRNSTYRHHRLNVTSCPLNNEEATLAEKAAADLIQTYEANAALMVTSLLHAATPCLAMGIPIILTRKDFRDRFTAINRLAPVHTPELFRHIDWTPSSMNVEAIKACLQSLMERALSAQTFPTDEQRQILADFYQFQYPVSDQLNAVYSQRKKRSLRDRIASALFNHK